MKRALVAVLVSAGVFALVVVLGDVRAQTATQGVAEALAEVSPLPAAAAFGLYALSYVGRALRLRVLLGGDASLLRLASIAARHNLLNLILPLRSGEASLPLMLKAETGRSLAEGAGALIVARVLDLASVAGFFLVGLAITRSDDEGGLALRVGGLLAASLVGLALMRPLARAVTRRFRDGTSRLAGFLARAGVWVGAQSSRRLVLASLVSAATWLLTYAACWLIVVDLGGDGTVGRELAEVTFPQSLLGSTFLHLAGILPVNTIAGVGPWEAGWTFGYVFAGVGRTAAFASAVVSHVLILGFVSLLGGAGFLLGRPAPEPTS